MEIIVDPNTSEFYTVGDNGAEMAYVPKGAIIFNHKQTEELLKNGYVTSSGGRGEAYVTGNAYASTLGAKIPNNTNKKDDDKSKSKKSDSKKNNNSTKKKDSKKTTKKKDTKKKDDKKKDDKSKIKNLDSFKKWLEKLFDWIEVKLDRLATVTEKNITKAERQINNLNFSGAAKSYSAALSSTNEQIKANEKGADKYKSKADEVLNNAYKAGLFGSTKTEKDKKKAKEKRDDIKSKVADGSIKIKEYGEKTREAISAYQEWYEKSLDCSKNVEDLLNQYTEYAEALYNLPLDKLNNKLEQIEKTTKLLNAKYDVADGYADSFKRKSDILESQNKQAAKTLKANENAAKETNSNLTDAKKPIDKVSDKALKGLTEKQQKQIVEAVKSGKEIDWTKYGKLSREGKEAIIAYNNALKANAKATENSKLAQVEYTKTLQTNAIELFNIIANDYSGMLSTIESESAKLNAMIDQTVAKGHKASSDFYDSLIGWEKDNLATQQAKRDALQTNLNESVEKGIIEEGSLAWYELKEQIDAADLSIIKANTSIVELGNSIRQLSWDKFDDFQNVISDLIDEADFLIDLLGESDLFDENGEMTDAGQATQAMHAQKYNSYMRKSDEYAKEIANIEKELAEDPTNVDLIERRKELVKAQRESILAANDEKKALQDLAKDGMDKVLDKLKELIDNYVDALESAKDLRDYQKNINDKTSNISSLRKQIEAYSLDTSEESRSKVQKLTNDLKKAEEDLEDTQYDRYISDTKEILNNVYDEYEKTLNERVDDIESVVQDAITASNNNTQTIKTTIDTECGKVGTTISSEMAEIWGSEGIGGALANYSANFSTEMTSLNSVIGGISDKIDKIYSAMDTGGGDDSGDGDIGSDDSDSDDIDTDDTDSKDTGGTTTETPTTTTSTEAQKNDMPKGTRIGSNIIQAGNGSFYINTKDKGWRQFNSKYLTEDIFLRWPELKEVLSQVEYGEKEAIWDKIRSIRDEAARRYKVLFGTSKHAAGVKNLLHDELAWTQENGPEAIIKPSRDAVIMPLEKGDSVLNASVTKNLWDLANNPTMFIKNRAMDMSSLYNQNHANDENGTYISNAIDLKIDLPNVSNYTDFMNAARSDPKFEQLIQAMTVDRISKNGNKSKHSIRW